jgi:hypothetical protein
VKYKINNWKEGKDRDSLMWVVTHIREEKI